MSFACQNSKLFGVYRFVWQHVAVLVNCESDARCNLKCSQKSCRYVSNFIWKTVREGEKKKPLKLLVDCCLLSSGDLYF